MNNNEKKQQKFGVIDLHTHILPQMDDGSSSVEESMAMLHLLYEQGAQTVVATPHFEAWIDSPESFFERRTRAAEVLKAAVAAEIQRGVALPRIVLGAEVAFFKGMSHSAALERLCIDGTRLLLVEMPFDKWDEQTLKEIIEIRSSKGIVPVIAHIDRYFDIQSKANISALLLSDVMIQINADSLLRFGARRRVIKMLLDGRVDFLGSDCHDMAKRSPNIGAAADVILEKCGESSISMLAERGKDVLCGATRLV